MSLRTIATLAIAIVLGLVAVVILNGYLGSQKKSGPAPVAAGAGAPVVVAAAPIKRGVVLQPSLLKVVNYPAGSVPAGAFSTVAQLTGAKDVQRLALRDLAPDEPVLAVRVTAPGGKLNLAGLLDPGMQAVTLHSTDIQEVSGFVLPGDHVDLLLTRSIGGGNMQQANSVTQILAENMKVLAIDQSDDDETDKPVVAHAITIEVTPEQAQLITLGQSVGAVTLALRHVDDTAPLGKKATVLAQLGFTAPPPLPTGVAGGGHPVRPSGPEVRVTRMTDTTVYQLSGH